MSLPRLTRSPRSVRSDSDNDRTAGSTFVVVAELTTATAGAASCAVASDSAYARRSMLVSCISSTRDLREHDTRQAGVEDTQHRPRRAPHLPVDGQCVALHAAADVLDAVAKGAWVDEREGALGVACNQW